MRDGRKKADELVISWVRCVFGAVVPLWGGCVERKTGRLKEEESTGEKGGEGEGRGVPGLAAMKQLRGAWDQKGANLKWAKCFVSCTPYPCPLVDVFSPLFCGGVCE